METLEQFLYEFAREIKKTIGKPPNGEKDYCACFEKRERNCFTTCA